MRLSAVPILILVAASPCSAQSATLYGRVTDGSGGPIANAQVFLVGTGITALTNATGAYALQAGTPGTYDVRAAFIGYRPRLVRKLVITADSTQLDWRLEANIVSVIADDFGFSDLHPLVPRDQTTTRWYISRELFANEPLR